MTGTTAQQFRALSEERLLDAKACLDAKRWSAAYYLAGYAVECALKAIALRGVPKECLPDKKEFDQVYNHNFDTLMSAAGLAEEFKMDAHPPE